MKAIPYNDESTIYRVELPVMVNHLNYGNHLGYDSVLSLLHEARIRWLKSHDMTEFSIEGSVGYLVVDVAASYRAEAFHGDLLEIALYIDEVDKRGFRMHYKMTNTRDGRTVAVAETGHMMYDYVAKKVARTPERLRALSGVTSQGQL